MFIFERLPFSPFKTRPHENNQKRYRVSNLIVIDFTGMNDNSEVILLWKIIEIVEGS